MKVLLKKAARFLSYLPWLLYKIVLANLDIAYRVLHPKMPIAPELVKFQSDLKTDWGLVVLANSITLTPGTVTVDLVEGEYIVHALTREAVESLGKMEDKVKRIEAG